MSSHKYTPDEANQRAEAKRYELHTMMQAGVQTLLTQLRQGKCERLLACLNFGVKFHRTISDPVVQNGYEEALLPYFSDCCLHTDLDLIEAIRGMLTEIAEEGHLTHHVLKHNTGFLLGILSLRG